MSATQPRILLVTNLYPQLLSDVYACNAGLADLDYEIQLNRLLASACDVTDSYLYELRVLGCEAQAVVVNADHMQNLWADDHELSTTGNIHDLRRRIVEAQIDYYGPDVVLVFEWSPLGDAFMRRIKNTRRFIVGHLASNLPPDRTLEAYDLVISSWPPLVEYFRGRGIAAEPLKLGFDARILDRLDHLPPRYDVTFVGGLGPAHGKRVTWLEGLLGDVDVDIFGYGGDGTVEQSPIRHRHHGPVWGWSMYQTLRQSRITLNMHGSIRIHGHDLDERKDRERILGPARRDSVPSLANNMRLFEATGVGTCLLTDAKDNLADLFEPETEVATYRDEAECVERIRYLLRHDEQRVSIARAGQQRTLRDHTNAVRIKELLDIIARTRT